MAEEIKKINNIGAVPVPDPTILTTQALLREVESLRMSTSHNNNMLRELIETRLDGNDQAVALLRTTTDKIPSYINNSILGLKELHQEKFDSIQTQFRERDTRTEQASKDSKVAIDAALSAQKESVDKQNISNTLAVNKSEFSFTKQVDEIGKRIDTVAKSLDEKVADIKDRITVIESRNQGILMNKSDTKDIWGYVIGAGGFVFGAVTLLVLLFKLVT